MRTLVIPSIALALTIVGMAYQAKTVEPALCKAPDARLGELPGFVSEVVPVGEAERETLPKDTIIDKRVYKDSDGAWYQVSLVIGGRSKSSIHRPELCLPSQGFQMMRPRDVTVGPIDWHVVSLERGDSPVFTFAYTFFNQEGFRTSSHVVRILRDVWDRSILGRIDRWVMVTVHSSVPDDRRLSGFLVNLREVIR